MSYQAVESVMRYSQMRSDARLILMVIATHADKDTFTATAGYATLAAESGMSERTLIRYLARMAGNPELTILKGNGRGNLTSYKINLPPVAPGERVTPAVTLSDPEKGDKTEQRVIPAVTLCADEKGDKSEIKGDKFDRKGDKIEIKGDKTDCAYKDIEPEEPWEPEETRGGHACAREGQPATPAPPSVPVGDVTVPVVRVIHASSEPVNPEAETRLSEIREAVRAAFGWPLFPQNGNARILESAALDLADNPAITPALVAEYAAQRDRAIYHRGFAGDLLTWHQQRQRTGQGIAARPGEQWATRNTANNRAAAEEAKRQFAERRARQKQG